MPQPAALFASTHPTFCDPVACDPHPIDPRHATTPQSVTGDSGVEVAVARTDWTPLPGQDPAQEWTVQVSVPVDAVTVREGRVHLQLPDAEAGELVQLLTAGRVQLRTLSGD